MKPSYYTNRIPMSVRATRLFHPSSIQKALVAAWPAWLVAAVCVVAALGGAGWHDALEYNRAAILGGEWWRIVTGNIVHMGTDHLLMDLAGMALLWILCAPVLAGWRWLAATAVGMVAVGVGLLLFDPSVAWYVGISGVLETYWAAGAILLIARRYREGWLLLAALVAKAVWEQTMGPVPLSEATAGGPVVVAAHLWGSIGGLIVGFALLLAFPLGRHSKIDLKESL
ncbi:MAG TPA: rhombosortase [Gammaproteobacteria bacterium]|nr:rhombosortase [Gammaproteobacteria bacterium]